MIDVFLSLSLTFSLKCNEKMSWGEDLKKKEIYFGNFPRMLQLVGKLLSHFLRSSFNIPSLCSIIFMDGQCPCSIKDTAESRHRLIWETSYSNIYPNNDLINCIKCNKNTISDQFSLKSQVIFFQWCQHSVKYDRVCA